MKHNPLVSVIIPAYNQAQFLPGAIRSVLDQTYQNFEIIVVDDGSVDNTREVACQYADRVCYIWQENKGLAGARNTGIRASCGEYIGLLDSDDEWMPTYLEKMVEQASQNPETAVFYCMAQSIDVNGNPLPQVFGGPVQQSQNIYHALVRANFLIPSTILMKKCEIEEVKLFDENLRSCEDWDLWLRLLPGIAIEGVDDILVNYRIHHNSLSTDVSGMHNAAQTVIEKHFGKDDGRPSQWSDLKKRAFGGLYFYFAWTILLRKGDWEAGGKYLLKCLAVDPGLIANLDVYYEILLGSQPPGYRGSTQFLDLAGNVSKFEKFLMSINSIELFGEAGLNLKKILGTAYYAASLLAYKSQRPVLCRKYMSLAIRNRPDLWKDTRIVTMYLKSLVPQPILLWLKHARYTI